MYKIFFTRLMSTQFFEKYAIKSVVVQLFFVIGSRKWHTSLNVQVCHSSFKHADLRQQETQ